MSEEMLVMSPEWRRQAMKAQLAAALDLPEHADLPWYKKAARECERKGRRRIIWDRADEKPYLVRYYLLPLWWNKTRLPNIVIHRFIKSDDPKDGMHDHPWPFAVKLLEGAYVEDMLDGPHVRLSRHGWRFMRATQLHAVRLFRIPGTDREAEVWTLFIMGFRRRKWGFVINGRWFHWKRYLADREAIHAAQRGRA